MQIILVSGHLRQARSVTIGLRHLAGATAAVLVLVVAMSAGMSYLTIATGIVARLPLGDRMVAAMGGVTTSEQYVRDNVAALAMRLGEMQAQMTRLDALGERLFSLTGLKVREAKPAEVPGRGGMAPDASSRPLTIEELQRDLDLVARRIELRGDELKVVEEELVRDRARGMLLPSAAPLQVTYQVSGFGRRIDPFSGNSAMHEGIDFAAAPGTPILAAASGFVITAEYHPSYGNMVEIDHGDGRTTRYAHASKLRVKPGERVSRGKHIADVGSTGSSTGPHLHFEVREHGVAQNPARFLLSTAGGAKTATADVARTATAESARSAESPDAARAAAAESGRRSVSRAPARERGRAAAREESAAPAAVVAPAASPVPAAAEPAEG